MTDAWWERLGGRSNRLATSAHAADRDVERCTSSKASVVVAQRDLAGLGNVTGLDGSQPFT
jgi:hypothetical protein